MSSAGPGEPIAALHPSAAGTGTAPFLRTRRLTLRRFSAVDEDALLALHSDPTVMRYLGAPSTRAEIRDEVLPRFLDVEEHGPGFGYWAAVEWATHTFVGWFELNPVGPDPVRGDVELGYRLRTSAWGRGLATEGSIALIDKGFAELGVQRIVATTMAVNAGSRRVMTKAGLRHVRTFHIEWPDPLPGSEQGEVEYAVTREEWARRQATDVPDRRSPS